MAVKKKSDEAEVKPDFTGVPPEITKVTEELSTALNDVEWNNRANELADAIRDTNEQKERKKSIMAELNADVKSAEAKQTKLAGIVANRREQRDVTVEVTKDFETGFVTRKRTDTGEEIGRREMTTLERQGSLLDANAFIEDAERGK